MRDVQLLAGAGHDVAKLLMLRKLCDATGDGDAIDAASVHGRANSFSNNLCRASG